MTGLLRSVWNAPAASPAPPRRVWRDWVLVGLLGPTVIIEAIARPTLPWVWVSAIVTLGLVATLLWRRTQPLLMLAIAFVGTTFTTVLAGPDEQLYTSVYLILLAYCVFRWGSGRAALGGAAIIVGISTVTTVLSNKQLGAIIGDMIGGLAVGLAIVALAVIFRTRATARQRELEQAKSFEREQLARDLHDTVAHHVSAIAIQAQAGLATAKANPKAATDALRVIEEEASRTLAEMRTMVRVLRRDDAAELAPNPRVSDVEALASTKPGGPVVTVQVDGDVEAVPGPVAAAIYRIAQESVTNARRHARHATRINVIIEADDAQVKLTVRDNGEQAPATSAGYGITGMTERAALLGGTFEAASDAGGWTVTAVLPRKGWVS